MINGRLESLRDSYLYSIDINFPVLSLYKQAVLNSAFAYARGKVANILMVTLLQLEMEERTKKNDSRKS